MTSRRCCGDILDIRDQSDISEELQRICPTSECGDGEMPVDGAFYIHQRTSFLLTYQFTKDISEVDVEIVDPRTIDFIFTYFILDQENNFFVASHLQGCCTNLFINDSNKTFSVVIDKLGFDVGKLMIEYRFKFSNELFIFNTSNVVFGEWTGLKLTSDLTKAKKPGNFSTKIYELSNFPYKLAVKFGKL